ncbi:hypothetical protein [Lacticaseibacillus manihotivorans]|jgi:hypothetical protein|uniref:Uncharacterized protein n=2 Tax=Lacticaseibacillus manihotivorans TaxID=88233 RepID=A0A0R1QR47_9LACO|nr:hypothetical protein [Lacticaseibacillus manihotivorans]KRL47197.1 hypothetical protein FD01_GL000366 [Lacticaseibacillus manihotivorans DSM 13343 = JCM 12514]QFQ90509.1 hypothetical protein LM010_03270 [Lacticaseibacillus manihotivorans]
MKIVSCVPPEEKSPDWPLFQLLATNGAIPSVEFEAIVIRDRNDILRIPNAQVRFEAVHDGLDGFPIVLVDGVIKTRGRLLTGAEYEDLIDGLSIQGA